YIMAPLMLGLAFIGEPVIKVLLTEKWLSAVFYMRVFCISYMFYPIHTANLNAIKAMGRSDLFLKLEIIKKVIGLVLLLITMNISVEAMAYSLLFTTITSQIINSWPNRKLLGYSYLEQIMDIIPNITLAVFMGVCIYFIQYIHISNVIAILLQLSIGASIYIICSKLFKIDSFLYVLDIVKSYRKHKEEHK
nr:polysaccharide biosynthesis C-terminal domain-containing protein [Lachnospiraceae bacterium]